MMKKLRISVIFLACAIFLGLAAGCDIGLHDYGPEQHAGIKGLRSLTVSGYQLDGGFSPDRERFSVFVDRAVVSLSAEAEDAGADVKFSVANPSSIVLKEGKNTVTVRVEGGKTFELDIWRCNATADTVDSVAGSVLEIPVRYRVYRGEDLLYTVEKGNARAQPLYLEDGRSYRVIADAEGRGSSALENVIRTKYSDRLSFICPRHIKPEIPAEAPRVLSMAWTTDQVALDDLGRTDIEWNEMYEGDLLDIAAISFVKVEMSSVSETDDTAEFMGTGPKLQFDGAPVVFSGMYPIRVDSEPDGEGRYHTTALFSLRNTDIVDGRHSVTFTAYDSANNRVRRDVRFISASGQPVPGAILKGRCAIVDFSIEATVWGTAVGLLGADPRPRSIQPGERGPTSAWVSLNFRVEDLTTNQPEPFFGFHIYRSDDAGASFTYLGTEHFEAISERTGNYMDTDSRLEIGKGYVYKVVAFTEAGAANEISAISAPVMLLPSFTMDLASPADGAHLAGGRAPTLKFRISEPGLWNPSVSDSFVFNPVIWEKDGWVKYDAMFKYDLVHRVLYLYDRSADDWRAFASGDDVRKFLEFDSDRGIVTLGPGIFVDECNTFIGDFILQSGVAYEWNILGYYSQYPPGFETWREVDSGIPGRPFRSVSLSVADGSIWSYESQNDWFTLIAD
jgi:hypothetical protein